MCIRDRGKFISFIDPNNSLEVDIIGRTYKAWLNGFVIFQSRNINEVFDSIVPLITEYELEPLHKFKIGFRYSDGGRKEAGYKGSAGDCAVRSIAIAMNRDYQDVYNDLFDFANKTPRNGVLVSVIDKYLLDYLGFRYMNADGKRLITEDLPMGIIICSLKKHVVCAKDRIIYDTYDCSKNGQRELYGYYVIK